MYNINWHTVAKRNIAQVLRQVRILDYIQALLKPLQRLNGTFDTFQSGVANRLKFSGAQIYLEHYLNDLFDPNDRNVYIDNPPQLDRRPIYTKAANQPARQIIYRKYDATQEYDTDMRVAYGERVYRSKVDGHTGNQPDTSPTQWEDEGERLAWYTKATWNIQDDFIVFMPDDITYDVNRLKSEINRYKPAGKNYSITNYTP